MLVGLNANLVWLRPRLSATFQICDTSHLGENIIHLKNL